MINQNKRYLIENINHYAGKLKFSDYVRNTQEYSFSEEEKKLVSYIQRMLPIMCNSYLKKEITSKELSEKANYIMFDKYNPSKVGRLVKKEVFDFLMLLGEADYYL